MMHCDSQYLELHHSSCYGALTKGVPGLGDKTLLDDKYNGLQECKHKHKHKCKHKSKCNSKCKYKRKYKCKYVNANININMQMKK